MARYIDADRLIERINASCAFPNVGEDGYFYGKALKERERE